MSREAGLRVDIHSDFEYIHESLLNWSRSGLRIQEIPLPVLAERPVGQSRIMRSVLRYAIRSGPVLIRALRDYSPLKFFGLLALLILVPAVAFGLWVLMWWLRTGETAPFTSFIVVSVGGVILAFLMANVALLADLIARVRIQVEELLYASRRSQVQVHQEVTDTKEWNREDDESLTWSPAHLTADPPIPPDQRQLESQFTGP
jgi:hypothetical protein